MLLEVNMFSWVVSADIITTKKVLSFIVDQVISIQMRTTHICYCVTFNNLHLALFIDELDLTHYSVAAGLWSMCHSLSVVMAWVIIYIDKKSTCFSFCVFVEHLAAISVLV